MSRDVVVRLTVPQAEALLECAGRGYDEIEAEVSDHEQDQGDPVEFGRRELANALRAWRRVRAAVREVAP